MITVKKLMSMRGRRALITGAGGFLGKVIADTLAEMGANLILVDRPGIDLLEVGNELTEKWGIKVEAFIVDLESERDRVLLIESINSDEQELNCMINNAAFVGTTDLDGWAVPFESQNLNVWRRAIEVNLTAPFHLIQGLAENISNSRGGNIINISSIYGELGPDWRLYSGTSMGNPAAYSASKGGLVQMTRWLATTIAPSVRVNAISPGGVYRGQPIDFVKEYEQRTPLARMATEDDFRGAIAYLSSDMSQYVTGEVIRVDGGWSTW